jgi:hypothetical protein
MCLGHAFEAFVLILAYLVYVYLHALLDYWPWFFLITSLIVTIFSQEIFVGISFFIFLLLSSLSSYRENNFA